MPRQPYPLQWPSDTRRTPPNERRESRFHSRPKADASTYGARTRPLSLYEASKEAIAEMNRLGAANTVITSMLPTRHDGLPYSDGRSEDPGIAVWCYYEGRERVFACDAWATPAENLRAITLSVAALRGLERWGMADARARALAGFAAALPPGSKEPAPPIKRNWREVFDVGETLATIQGDDLVAVLRARHRKAIAEAHPDVGGSTERATELNVALDEAIAELAR